MSLPSPQPCRPTFLKTLRAALMRAVAASKSRQQTWRMNGSNLSHVSSVFIAGALREDGINLERPAKHDEVLLAVAGALACCARPSATGRCGPLPPSAPSRYSLSELTVLRSK